MYNPEHVSIISKEIFERVPNTHFQDIAGLKESKVLLVEAVMLPIWMPDIFTEFRRPWKGLLMVGPPGSGKTMLAKAVATKCKTIFFNISSSTLISKYLGESEKLVRLLFEMAKAYAPSTIFIDEIESLFTSPGNASEHEATRRVRSELLIQMDGITSTDDPSKPVLVLAATNMPWMLDSAMLRRLEKRIYIPLLNTAERLSLLNRNLSKMDVSPNLNIDVLAKMLEGYSGADITNVCRDASMMCVRKIIDRTLMDDPEPAPEHFLRIPMLIRPVTMGDFRAATQKRKKLVSREKVKEYESWIQNYGSS